MTDNIVRAFTVRYEDQWLEVDDFKTIKASDEDEARERFRDEYLEEDRAEITEVEEAYELNKTRVQELMQQIKD